MTGPWRVYILRCGDGSLYVGSTTDLDRRLAAHAAGKGGRYTRARRPVKLVYQEKQADRSDAQRREWQIKGWTRAEKLMFIKRRRS